MPGGTPMVRTEKGVDGRLRTAGDAAVDGLLAGGAAGIAMGVYLAVSVLLLGEGPARMLARFDPAGSAAPVAGVLMHLAVSAVYGLVFGVIYRLAGPLACCWGWSTGWHWCCWPKGWSRPPRARRCGGFRPCTLRSPISSTAWSWAGWSHGADH